MKRVGVFVLASICCLSIFLTACQKDGTESPSAPGAESSSDTEEVDERGQTESERNYAGERMFKELFALLENPGRVEMESDGLEGKSVTYNEDVGKAVTEQLQKKHSDAGYAVSVLSDYETQLEIKVYDPGASETAIPHFRVDLYWCGRGHEDFNNQTVLWLTDDLQTLQFTFKGNRVKPILNEILKTAR